MKKIISLCLIGLGLLTGACALAEERFIIVTATTSTENSGLFDHILPLFEDKTGIEVRVVAVGTGQAIEIAKRGDADVLFVHHKPSEEQFVAEGHGVERYDVMYNDYIIVGPESDPAGIHGMQETPAALKKIAEAEALFVSRGDDSGTHKKELSLWQEAGIDPRPHSGDWYREAGSGMGATLNTASGLNAYTLSDRGTWISFRNKGDLEILIEGDPRLFNPYGVIRVNPEKHPHVKAEAGQIFIDWLTSEEGQQAIASFKLDDQQLFFPNAAAATTRQGDNGILVFAAASLTEAMEAIMTQFRQSTGTGIKASYASSSTLARQIEQGAPADVYVSAHPRWMDYLDQRGLLAAGTRIGLLENALVLVAPRGSAIELTIAPGFPLAAALGGGRLAMGDPDHVPAGMYGRAALESLGVWHSVAARIIRADNVRVALALVSRGEAPLGIVYRSDAVADPGVRAVDDFPADSHPPIVYPAALAAESRHPAAAGFLAFLHSPAAASVFERYGFSLVR